MSSEAYSGVVAPPVQSHNNMHLSAFGGDGGTAIYKPMPVVTSPTYQSAAGNGDSSGVPQMNMAMSMGMGGETTKRKRGRPRKYGPDGTISLGLTPPTQSVQLGTQSPAAGGGAFSPPLQSHPGGGSVSPSKKARGRPPGSGKKHQMEALGSAGIGFTPHVITVKAGEDVASKIMAFSQHGPRAVCILSANGAISNVTLRQPATSGGSVTYEGRFEILSLSGSSLLTESGGHRSRKGGLSVSLAGPDGRVLGGGVAGVLTAASPVQVIIGSFIADGRKEPKPPKHIESLMAPQKLSSAGGVTGASSPLSHGTYSESSGGPGSPLNQSNNSNPHGMSGIPWK